MEAQRNLFRPHVSVRRNASAAAGREARDPGLGFRRRAPPHSPRPAGTRTAGDGGGYAREASGAHGRVGARGPRGAAASWPPEPVSRAGSLPSAAAAATSRDPTGRGAEAASGGAEASGQGGAGLPRSWDPARFAHRPGEARPALRPQGRGRSLRTRTSAAPVGDKRNQEPQFRGNTARKCEPQAAEGRVSEWLQCDNMHHQWLLLAACFWVIFMFMVASKFITLTFKDPDVYSARQEFLFLTTMPEVRKLPEEKHIPEELKEPFLPLRRSPKTWCTTTRRTAFLGSLPSVMQKFRSGSWSRLSKRRVECVHGSLGRLKTYFKFFIVRDPFERLISAFKDKFVHNPRFEPWYRHEIAPGIIRKYRRNRTETRGIQFEDFVRYLGDPNHRWLDLQFGDHIIHWVTYVELCAPCEIMYSVIGHHETLEDDAPYILKEAGIDHLVSYPTIPPGITVYNRTKVEHYFLGISKRDIRRLYARFEGDFKLFGYQKPDFLLN
uniref:carbohydrate sulfotransferase 10 isoform X3 n=1 Tax=Macaca mulatta TaxID=9544 RepID=UPI0010A22740|nr:carbohydrate sulfotransferase 10 isoform X3 [Macaca mulatta]